MNRGILIAIDSVGIDPLGHDRPESVYSESRFLFPKGAGGGVLSLPEAPVEGALVETDVTGGLERGGIECSLTYTAIFSGTSAVAKHGLVSGLALKDSVLEEMIGQSNLLRLFPDACVANAIFPAHLRCFGQSYVEDLLPCVSRERLEEGLHFQGELVRLTGKKKHGFPELFTLAEINQNIFIHAARQAGLRLRSYDDVRAGEALTSTMTHELEARFDLRFFGEAPLPVYTPEQAAAIIGKLAERHSFVFYKYQMPDLISHTGRVDLARETVAVIERFIGALLQTIDAEQTFVVVTSDHGHLEQVGFSKGHPKTKVPTWYFGPHALQHADSLRTPEAIFHQFAALRAH